MQVLSESQWNFDRNGIKNTKICMEWKNNQRFQKNLEEDEQNYSLCISISKSISKLQQLKVYGIGIRTNT